MPATSEKPAIRMRGHRTLDHHVDIDGGAAEDHESIQSPSERSEKQRRRRNRNSESQDTRDNHNMDGGEASNHRSPFATRSRARDSRRDHLPGKYVPRAADTSSSKDQIETDANDKGAGWHSTQLKRRIRDKQPLEFLNPSDARLGMLILFDDREPATSRQLQQDIRAAHDGGKRLAEGYLEVEYDDENKVIGSTPLCVKQRPGVIVEMNAERCLVCRLYTFSNNGLRYKSDIEREEYVGVQDHRNQEPLKPRYGRLPLLTGYLKRTEGRWDAKSFIKISDSHPLNFGTEKVKVLGSLVDDDTDTLRRLRIEYLVNEHQRGHKESNAMSDIKETIACRQGTGMTAHVAKMDIKDFTANRPIAAEGDAPAGVHQDENRQDIDQATRNVHDIPLKPNAPHSSHLGSSQELTKRGTKRDLADSSCACDASQVGDHMPDTLLPKRKRRMVGMPSEHGTVDADAMRPRSSRAEEWFQKAVAKAFPRSQRSTPAE